MFKSFKINSFARRKVKWKKWKKNWCVESVETKTPTAIRTRIVADETPDVDNFHSLTLIRSLFCQIMWLQSNNEGIACGLYQEYFASIVDTWHSLGLPSYIHTCTICNTYIHTRVVGGVYAVARTFMLTLLHV